MTVALCRKAFAYLGPESDRSVGRGAGAPEPGRPSEEKDNAMVDAVPSLSYRRLLCDGLQAGTGGEQIAEPLTPQGLCDPVVGFGLDPAESALFSTASLSESEGVRFLEATVPGKLPGPVYLCGRSSSSLDVAAVLAAAGLLPPWSSVIATAQTRGRGQLRRVWISPPGNIYAAIRLPRDAVFAGSAAACVTGGLLAEALRRIGVPVAMKWPNDMLLFDRGHAGKNAWTKVGGILLEERSDVLLAGIGLNTAGAPESAALREGHALPAGRLPLPAAFCSTLSAWSALVEQMVFCYAEVKKHGERARLDFARNHLAFKGYEVEVADGDAPRQRGRLMGLDEEGGLQLALDGKGRGRGQTSVFYSGSLALPESFSADDAR